MTRAIVVSSSAVPAVQEIDLAPPGPGEALVDVTFSSINYKDGMALAGDPGVKRIDPLVPGIDVVGRIAALGSSTDPTRLSVGDRVVLNGAGAGERRHGGLAAQAVVPLDALVRLPDAIPDARAAAIGTAGFTAMLSVLALERFVAPEDGPVVVTGSSGGVGSVAIALLAARGYAVTAATGRPERTDALRALGATDVVDRAELRDTEGAMQRARWAGAVDCVGGRTLANLLAQTRWGGAVTSCGMAESTALDTTVLPFILRAVALLGINSVDAPLPLREQAWARLASDLDPARIDMITETIGLEDAVDAGRRILDGRTSGRIIVEIN
ncbi:MDR family oxidoreductase [Curtobacterium sp. Leaf261]|uniref:MDR family oxidoreductase n=1 Tax=Curtobacterium sp. Leaf261 TaxID=1736311 RepID=UPI0006F89804|nr:MDR family oxidoreductase [Curtobacterium sp. Leaf261]KQO63791.1 NADPH:quinone dehydrogenase [Curtobacterium sp. Leaf261]